MKPFETLDDLIKKQNDLNCEFDLKNEEFTFYGSSQDYNNYYESLKKNKSFKVDPKKIFIDFYKNEIIRLQIKENEIKKQKIFDLFINKQNEIKKYFSILKFYEEIDMNFDLKLEIEPDNINLSNYKLERENDLKFFFDEKIKEKRKEWQEQVERAKWKVPVQARGLLKCKNGHHFEKDLVVCGKCHENLYWVDSDERYAMCQKCEGDRKSVV